MLDEQGRHFPSNPEKFVFDAEVARVFPDMSLRALPNFHMAHQMHVAMADEQLSRPGCRVLDVGASRGAFLMHIRNRHRRAFDSMHVTAIDNSPDMCGYLKEDFPTVHIKCEDLAEESSIPRDEKYEVVCVNYVLQFLSIEDQTKVLNRLMNAVAPGGFLFLGHKSAYYGKLGDLMHERYIDFRTGNGYTREEIKAKTKALAGSMFCMDHDYVMDKLKRHFMEVNETTRFMMFATIAARK